jgi:alkylated DNA repair dioxygenase AlkB
LPEQLAFPWKAAAPGVAIPGLEYTPEYLSALEEAELLTQIDRRPWRAWMKRRVQHYGFGYAGRTRNIAPVAVEALPGWALQLARRFVSEGRIDQVPDQVTINEYFPGQGIAAHSDYLHFGGTVLDLSLLSPCVMEFLKGRSRIPLALEPRSLLTLRGESRYDWEHRIPARKADVFEGRKWARERRVSVTFRRLRDRP